MSNPANAAAPGDFPEVDASEGEKETSSSFRDRVNEAVKGMTQNDDGLWQVPDGLPEEVAVAAEAEKRRRDTQSAYSKNQQELAAIKAEKEALIKRLASSVQLNLSVAEAEELEDLKNTDPDAWRSKLNEYEERAAESLKKELSEVSETASEASEIERRAQVLTDFLEANPGLILNDEVFENDLPPRITGPLERGEASFEEFLDEAKKFLTKGKKIKTDKDESEPNLSKAGGGDSVLDHEIEQDITTTYKDTVF